MVQRLLIDTDTASDDAVALVLALRTPGVSVEAVTVVAGNVPLAMGLQAALYTTEICGSDVPVYAGMEQPMVRPPRRTAQHVHGQDGMGDIGLALTGRTPSDGHAVNTIVDSVRASPGEITVVTLGPLTNLGMALRMAPDIAASIPRVVVMGGYGREVWGHSKPQEFNIMIDPDAARIVYDSGIPITQVGLDVSMLHGTIAADDEERLRRSTALGRFCVDIQAVLKAFCRDNLGLDGFTLPDPVAMAVALAPSIVTREQRAHVAIETQGVHTTGATVVHHSPGSDRPANVDVVLDIDRQKFIEMLVAAVS